MKMTRVANGEEKNFYFANSSLIAVVSSLTKSLVMSPHKKLLLLITICPFTYSSLKAQTFRAGQLHPGRVDVILDDFDDFHDGYAIVRKGDDFGLMIGNGQMAVEFGVYKFNTQEDYKIDKERCGFYNSMCVVRDPVTEMYGAIDENMELAAPCKYEDMTRFGADGYAWAKRTNDKGQTKFYFVDKSGKEFVSNQSTSSSFGIGQYIYRVQSTSGYTFYHKNGRRIFTTKRNVQGNYSEGRIRVDTVLGIAGRRVGFIDTNDRLVIPYKFVDGQRTNHEFRNGLCMMQPPTMEEGRYFYIGIDGVTRFQIQPDSRYTDFSPTSYDGSETGAFVNGMADYYCSYTKPNGEKGIGEVMVDTLGNTFPMLEMALEAFRKMLPQCTINFDAVRRKHNGYDIHFDATYDCPKKSADGSTVYPRYFAAGIVSRDGTKMIPPVFSEIGFPDARNEKTKAMLKRENGEVTAGYVDLEGRFMIVVTEP